MKTIAIILATLNSNEVQFIYEPYEDGASAPCTHKTENPSNPYDLTVICVDDKGRSRQFTAHLALSRYTHPTPPRVSYELLYWVNGNGATTWFHFENETALMLIESSQNIANEPAGLRLIIKVSDNFVMPTALK